MFPALLSATAALLVLAVVWTNPVAARQRPSATPSPPPIAADIADPVERDAFVRVWRAGDPAVQRDLAVRFVTDYPRTVLLRETYEIAARASLSMGDGPGALTWGERALRLLPENVPLLVMVADLAAKLREQGLAERSARAALRLLDTALPPPAVPPDQWDTMRRGLRATAHTALGRVAAERADHAGAERELVTALGLDPGDQEALYLLGVVRLAAGNDEAAAPPLGAVAQGAGPLAANALRLLRSVHGRTRPAADFDAFVASLRVAPPSPPAPVPQVPVAGRYAGSEACRTCHVEEYERWQGTGMARMLRAYRPENVIGDFANARTVDGRARAVLDGGRHFVEIRSGGSQEWTRYPVDYTIGSKWQQAYATTLPDRRMLVFPIQYSRDHGGWINYWKTVDAPGSARADIARFHEVPEEAVYQTTCAPCHTSQLRFAGGVARPEAATFHEGGVNCETCHGPAASHVEAYQAGRAQPRAATAPPVRFAGLTAVQSVAICAQCHAQSAVHDALETGEVNYGVRGSWYRVYPTHLVSSFPRRALYRDGRFRATTFVSEAFARTRCFQTGQATCASCHDPHPPDPAANPTSLKFGADDDRMCLQCHSALAAAPERHTRHAAGSEASRCVTCHMPRIAEALVFKARSHQIDDIPDAEMAARFGAEDSPNVCLDCHRNQGVTWLSAALAARRR